jgi:hypothetical protein
LGTLNADVDVAADNMLRSLVCLTTSTGFDSRRTIELAKANATAAHQPLRWENQSGYKAIAADLGAASLLATGITAAAVSVECSYRIDGVGTTATQGPDPTTLANESFSPVIKATPPLRIHE